MKAITSALIFAAMLVAGCTPNSIIMCYHSTPKGAFFYQDDKEIGFRHACMSYSLAENDRKTGIIFIKPVTAVWKSGYTITSEPKILQIKDGYYQSYTFERPKSDAGYEVDLKAGLLVEMVELGFLEQNILLQQQQQQQTQEMLNSWQQSPQQSQNQQPTPNTSHCRTKMVNGQIQAYCW